MGQGGSQILEDMEKNSNCGCTFTDAVLSILSQDHFCTVSAPEIQRLRRRFMKLDRDGSGSIDKEEFLQIPQIANNPLASRLIAIFDEESV